MTILKDLSRDLGVPVITPEYEIVLSLIDWPGLTAQTLFAHSSLSSTGFFATLDRLKHLNVVQCAASRQDKRVRMYNLAPVTTDLFVARLAASQKYQLSFLTKDLKRKVIRGRGWNERISDNITRLTVEYQIILSLYVMADMTNSQIIEVVDGSATKINVTLKALGAKGLIRCKAGESDRRCKHYQLCDAARRIIDNSNGRVFDWLDALRLRTLPATTHQLGSVLSSAVT